MEDRDTRARIEHEWAGRHKGFLLLETRPRTPLKRLLTQQPAESRGFFTSRHRQDLFLLPPSLFRAQQFAGPTTNSRDEPVNA